MISMEEGKKDFIAAPTEEQIVQNVLAKFPDLVNHRATKTRRVYFKADIDVLFSLCKYMRDEMNFVHCSCVSGVDWETHLGTVYHISNYETGIMVEISVDIPYDKPEVDSVTPLWNGANFHEREAAELFGIVFNGHPDPRKLLLIEEYDFYPFRKSFKPAEVR